MSSVLNGTFCDKNHKHGHQNGQPTGYANGGLVSYSPFSNAIDFFRFRVSHRVKVVVVSKFACSASV